MDILAKLSERPINNRASEQGKLLPVAHRDPQQGNWFPAYGGTAEPETLRNGLRVLYCWQPTTGNHAFINLDTDMLLSVEEYLVASGTIERKQ